MCTPRQHELSSGEIRQHDERGNDKPASSCQLKASKVPSANSWCEITLPKRAGDGKHWSVQLRVLLPDGGGAACVARRDALWQQLGGGGEFIPAADCESFFFNFYEFVIRAGLGGEAKRLQFFGAALRASAEMVGLDRGAFRYFIMRMHQYLDVHAVLESCDDPHLSMVGFDDFVHLLCARGHTLPPTLLVKANRWDGNRWDTGCMRESMRTMFSNLCESEGGGLSFDALARWSVTLQMVRPGSGAMVRQQRYPAHWVDPDSVGLQGYVESPRGVRPPPPAKPRDVPPPPPPPPLPPPPPPPLRPPRASVAQVASPPRPLPLLAMPHEMLTMPPPLLPPYGANLEYAPEQEPVPPPRATLPPKPPPPSPPKRPKDMRLWIPRPPDIVPRLRPAPPPLRKRRAQMGTGICMWKTTGQYSSIEPDTTRPRSRTPRSTTEW